MSERPRLYWCPTGPFAMAPLHAAGVYHGPQSQRECCADYVVSSYTPTLTSLLRAQSGVVSLTRKDLAMMLLAEKRAQEPLAPIPGVELEIRDIATIAGTHNVNIVSHLASATTVSRTIETIKEANIMHLACHGIQDHENATRSGFCLGDGRLTISDLMELNIKDGFLAFLSACETARGSEDQPDQAMHLAAAMLFVGFKSVVATMWSVERLRTV
jgi:CHAT domain-containing protein